MRLSYAKNGSGTEIIEENNYYPFGLKHQGYNQALGNPAYKYQYNGKELQQETGWSDFGARMYMADIGRWGVIDPLAETSTRFTPYNYAYNNPISFIDPDGRKAIAPSGAEMLQPMDGALGYMLNGGSATFGSFTEFLGQGTPFWQLNNTSSSGGGGGTPIGEPITYEEALSFLGLTPGGVDFSKFDFSQAGVYGGFSVKLLIWPGNEDVGHTAININGTVYGYYPTDINGDGLYTKADLRNSPGKMHIDRKDEFYKNYYGDTIVSYDVRISASNAKKLEQYLQNVAKTPGNYSLFGLNCTSVAIQALSKNGISIYSSQTTYNRFDGSTIEHKLVTGFGVSPNRLMETIDNGLNKYLFYNRTKYILK